MVAVVMEVVIMELEKQCKCVGVHVRVGKNVCVSACVWGGNTGRKPVKSKLFYHQLGIVTVFSVNLGEMKVLPFIIFH